MKHSILSSILILITGILFGQMELQLKYIKHIATTPIPNYAIANAKLNDNGWTFFNILQDDSLIFDGNHLDRSIIGSRIMAFDGQGKLRWFFRYDIPKNTAMGGMSVLATGKDNSLFVGCGASDSLIIDTFKHYHSGSATFLLKFDSNGKVVNIQLNNSMRISATIPFYDNEVFMFGAGVSQRYSSTGHQVLYQSAFGMQGSHIDRENNIYSLYHIPANRTKTIGDTTFQTGQHALWAIASFDSSLNMRWFHIADTRANFELNENKQIRCDKYGNVFVTLQQKVAYTVDGVEIPFYKNPDSLNAQIKASILRFDSKTGKLLSVYTDPDSLTPSFSFRQTIWLETDVNMELYAYL